MQRMRLKCAGGRDLEAGERTWAGRTERSSRWFVFLKQSLLPFWEEHWMFPHTIHFHLTRKTFKKTHPALKSSLAGLLQAGPGKPWAENPLWGEREARSGISEVQEPARAQVNPTSTPIRNSISNSIIWSWSLFKKKWSRPHMLQSGTNVKKYQLAIIWGKI